MNHTIKTDPETKALVIVELLGDDSETEGKVIVIGSNGEPLEGQAWLRALFRAATKATDLVNLNWHLKNSMEALRYILNEPLHCN